MSNPHLAAICVAATNCRRTLSMSSRSIALGVALPGAFGFALSVREQLILHRGIPLTQQGWLSALVLTVATNGARIARVFVACGIVYFWAQLAARIRAEARRALTKLTRVLDRNVVVAR